MTICWQVVVSARRMISHNPKFTKLEELKKISSTVNIQISTEYNVPKVGT
jgi:hypothetical protein